MTWIPPQPKPSRFTNGQRATIGLTITGVVCYGAIWVFGHVLWPAFWGWFLQGLQF